MECDWEHRATGEPPWPEGLVRSVAAAVLDEPGDVTRFAGGLANHNWRVEGATGPVVVRAWTRDAGRADVECALLAEVADRVPVPRVLHRASVAGVPVAVLQFLEGQRLADVWPQLTPEQACEVFADAGRVLHAIGDQGYASPGLFGMVGGEVAVVRPFPSVAEAWRGYLSEVVFSAGVGEVLGQQRVARLWSAVATWGEVLESETEVVLSHSDFKPENLLVQPGPTGWRVSGVLDWEFSWAGSPWFDVGQLLRWEHVLPAGVADAFASAWPRFVGELPSDWRLRSRLLDLMNLCGLLVGSGERPRLRSDVLELLDRSLAELSR